MVCAIFGRLKSWYGQKDIKLGKGRDMYYVNTYSDMSVSTFIPINRNERKGVGSDCINNCRHDVNRAVTTRAN